MCVELFARDTQRTNEILNAKKAVRLNWQRYFRKLNIWHLLVMRSRSGTKLCSMVVVIFRCYLTIISKRVQTLDLRRIFCGKGSNTTRVLWLSEVLWLYSEELLQKFALEVSLCRVLRIYFILFQYFDTSHNKLF